MKKLFAVLLLSFTEALVSCSAQAVELGIQPDGDVVVRLPAAVVQDCKENGGCNLVNRVEFIEAVNRTIQENKKDICDYKEAAK